MHPRDDETEDDRNWAIACILIVATLAVLLVAPPLLSLVQIFWGD